MNFLKKGPEIKLSEIKVPGPVRDVYYDLKDRHLLPLAAILLIAIVVVPFALANSASEEPAEDAAGGGAVTAQGSSAGGESGELVAKSAPGLRDYKKRLEHLKSKNPFHQQYLRGEKSGEGSSGSEGGGGSSTTTGTEGSSSTGGGTGGSETESGSTQRSKITYYSYTIDVRVTSGGAQSSALTTAGGTAAKATAKKKVKVRRNLPELTMLPSREAPALTFMGPTKDGKKALMLISSDVSALFGDAKCVVGSSTCQMLALEVGLPETVVYGANNRTYKIELLKIQLVETDKLNKAPLGKPHKHPEG